MTHRELFEANNTIEADAPFETVAELCDFMEEDAGPTVLRDIMIAKHRFEIAMKLQEIAHV